MENNMIPKVVHYCWFGGNQLPDDAKKCIESWRKFFPEYEIKEWNECNFDVNCCDYVKEAYAAKKWAFVSDYARFWILYHEGGLYFDTDVEVIKDMSDIIAKGAFMGCETDNKCAPGGGGGVQTPASAWVQTPASAWVQTPASAYIKKFWTTMRKSIFLLKEILQKRL